MPALHIAVGSSLQIALLVTPLLVFLSLWIAPRPLELHFTILEVLALAASVVIVALVAADGISHWIEGVMLLAIYIILALAFYHVPGTGASTNPEADRKALLRPSAAATLRIKPTKVL